MNKYLLGLFGATLAWGLSFALVKEASLIVGITPFFGVRFWGAAIILALLFRKKAVALSLSRLLGAAVLGILLFLTLWFQTLGLQTISASRCGFITSFYVPLTPLLGFLLFRKPPTSLQLILVGVACVGLAFMSFPSDLSLNQIQSGDLLTLAGAFAAALHIVLTGLIAKRENNLVALGFWQFVFVALLCTLGSTSHSLAFWNWPPRILWLVTICTLFATCFAFMMQIICQKRVDAVQAAIIFSLEAPFALLFGALLLGETLVPREIAGALLLFVASVVPEKKTTKTKRTA